MAAAVQFENILLLVDGSTITGPKDFSLLLTAGSDAASLTLSDGSHSIVLKAAANESQSLPDCLSLGNSVTWTVSLTGTSPTAYAIIEEE